MVAKRELLESLRQQVRRIETAGRPGTAGGSAVSLGCAALDGLLPQKGLPRGTIHEWLAPYRGSGAEILSLIAAREACRDGGALLVVDAAGCLYPPAAAAWGIALENTIILRPESRREEAWAIDQALRCSAVAAVWGLLGLLDERWLRRFQLSAEQSGCLGLFVRPAAAARRPAWSESQWWCRSLPPAGIGIAAEGAEVRLDRQGHAGRQQRGEAGKTGPGNIVSGKGWSRSTGTGTSTGLAERVGTSGLLVGEDRLIHLRLARLRGGLAGGALTLRIDFQSGELREARESRESDESNRVRLSRRLADPAAGRRAASA
jgi:hypothetical protein